MKILKAEATNTFTPDSNLVTPENLVSPDGSIGDVEEREDIVLGPI